MDENPYDAPRGKHGAIQPSGDRRFYSVLWITVGALLLLPAPVAFAVGMHAHRLRIAEGENAHNWSLGAGSELVFCGGVPLFALGLAFIIVGVVKAVMNHRLN